MFKFILFIVAVSSCARSVNVKREFSKIKVTSSVLLYSAARSGNTKEVKRLLKAGADKDRTGIDGDTPLCAASCYGHAKVVELLLKARAEVDGVYTCTRTPLYLASSYGHQKVVEMLLASGADKYAITDGETPLVAASYQGHAGVVKVLLEAGVKVDIKLIVNVAERGHKEVVEMLLASGGNVKCMNGKSLIHYLAEFDMCDKILDLNLSNEEMNTLSRYGRNVVHFAVASNLDVAAVRTLVEAGCKLGVKDKGGSLPIDITLKANNLELFTFLYERMKLDEETKGLIPGIKERAEKSKKSKLVKSYLQQVEAVDVGETSDEVIRPKRKRFVVEDDPADEVVNTKKMKKVGKGKKRK